MWYKIVRHKFNRNKDILRVWPKNIPKPKGEGLIFAESYLNIPIGEFPYGPVAVGGKFFYFFDRYQAGKALENLKKDKADEKEVSLNCLTSETLSKDLWGAQRYQKLP